MRSDGQLLLGDGKRVLTDGDELALLAEDREPARSEEEEPVIGDKTMTSSAKERPRDHADGPASPGASPNGSGPDEVDSGAGPQPSE